jgi:hypothetical protein
MEYRNVMLPTVENIPVKWLNPPHWNVPRSIEPGIVVGLPPGVDGDRKNGKRECLTFVMLCLLIRPLSQAFATPVSKVRCQRLAATRRQSRGRLFRRAVLSCGAFCDAPANWRPSLRQARRGKESGATNYQVHGRRRFRQGVQASRYQQLCFP